jgi:peroxiredoxin Q/BCP
MTLVPGDPIPDFTLSAGDGRTLSRADLAGRPAVLFFYPKDGTAGCTLEARAFSDHAADFAALGVAVYGISADDDASHARFRSRNDLRIDLLADPQTVTLAAFGVWAEKAMYGRRFMGVVRTTLLVGADGRVVTAWNKVKPAGHAEAVLAAARALVGRS